MAAARSAADLRRWAENLRVASERERQEVRASGRFIEDPSAAALELIAIAEQMYGWPVPPDLTRQREDEIAWETWTQLRRALGRQ